MGKGFITFSDIEIKRRKFHYRKNLILFEDLDINNAQLTSMVSSGEKNCELFIGYKDHDDYKIKPLHLMLPKTSTYLKSYDRETRRMNFFIKDASLLKNCTDI